MPDFQFLQDPISKKWISLSPRRSRRPDEAKGPLQICPFCPGNEREQPSVYVILGSNATPESRGDAGQASMTSSDWLVRVIPNKFPFAPIHEVIIHSPDHHKSFGELPVSQTELILQTYRQRYNIHKEKGQVYIFNNTGEQAGESLAHPHSQLAVVPKEVSLDISEYQISDELFLDAGLFRLGCPDASQWPDEVWFVPKETGKTFGDISDEEIKSLAEGLDRLIKIYDYRYGHEFPFNFFIRPGLDWYLRLIPRVKSLGGFEVGSGVYVNTQDPKDTVAFLKQHWQSGKDGLDFEKIQKHEYGKHV